ncbi:MAG: hypothetical protein VB099_19980 [Candidatus Limiplasma sp.]|nr:hypothetical protein [Candidatus Limiplasma sp.]
MSDTIIVALVSFAATLITGMGGYKLIAYRVEQLEKVVEKHNGVVGKTAILEEKMCVANHRIGDLEDEVKRLSA